MAEQDRFEAEELQKNDIPEEPVTAEETPETAESGEAGAAEGAEEPAGEAAAAAEASAEETSAEEASAEEETAGETSEETPEEGDPEEEEPRGFFRRRKKEDKEKTALKEKVAELEDRSLRQLAEFENFRRRTEKEKEQRFSMGEKNVIEKILPVVDNFERGLASMPEEERGSAFASGMEMIYKQLMKQLEDLGVKPIEAVGQPFDPNFHNAVMQVESEEYESGTVAQEFQKGYLYHDTVVRYSMVGVVA